VLDEVVASREALVGDTVAARHSTGELGSPESVDGGLVALEVGQAREVGGGGAGGDVAGPCSV
jgi:hypothetical protein